MPGDETSYCWEPPGTNPPTSIDMFRFINSSTKSGKLGAAITLTPGLVSFNSVRVCGARVHVRACARVRVCAICDVGVGVGVGVGVNLRCVCGGRVCMAFANG